MGTACRQYSASFKAKVAIEGLKECETLAELDPIRSSQEVISHLKTEFIK